MKDFHTLKVWEKAHTLTLAIYKSTELFPKQEMYGLTSQIQRGGFDPNQYRRGVWQRLGCRVEAIFPDCNGFIQKLKRVN